MLKKELKKELNRTKLILDYAREEIKVKDKEIKQLKSQLQQKENIIKEVREKLIKSKEYQAVKSLGFNSKMSILIELEEILDKEVN